MTGMKAEEADRFYEEDEDPGKIFAIIDNSEHGITSPPAESPGEQGDNEPSHRGAPWR